MEIREAIEKYLAVAVALQGMAELTVRAYRSDYRSACRFFIARGIGEISGVTTALVTDYFVTLRKNGLNLSTIHRRKNALSSLFAYCVEQGWLAVNPVTTVRLQAKPRTSRNVVLKHDDVRGILAADVNYRSVPADTVKAVMPLLVFGGMRTAELVGLNWENVYLDPGNERLTIYNSKNTNRKGLLDGKDRDIPLCSSVSCALNGIPYRTGPVLQAANGRRLCADAVRKIVARACEAAGLGGRGLTPHCFRHNLASQLSILGYTEADISLVLGHKALSVTQGYIHSTLDRVRMALQAYDDAISGEPTGRNSDQGDIAPIEEPPGTVNETSKGVLGDAQRWWALFHGGSTVPEDFVLGFIAGRRSSHFDQPV